jgi:hypothetical protein
MCGANLHYFSFILTEIRLQNSFAEPAKRGTNLARVIFVKKILPILGLGDGLSVVKVKERYTISGLDT